MWLRRNLSRVLLVVSCFSFLSVSCGVDSPKIETLIEAFNHDVVNFGFNRYSDRVNSQISRSGTVDGFSRASDSVWSHQYGSIVLISTGISPNESDRFPFKGNIKYKVNLRSWSGNGSIVAVAYVFGKETKQWIRQENVTP